MKTCSSIIITAIIIAVFTSCSNSSKKNEETSDTIAIKTESVPDGYVLGKAVEYKPKNKSESNLINQFHTYMAAVFLGDFESASKYLCDDAFNYFKKQLGEEKDKKSIIQELFKGAVNASNVYKNNNIEMQLVVCDIIRSVNFGETQIKVFTGAMNLITEKKSINTYDENEPPTIAISNNSGRNWTFMAINDNTPTILSMRFNQEEVSSIMGY